VLRSVVWSASWLAALTVLWLLYVGVFDRVDFLAGLMAAAVAAIGVEAVRRQGLLRFCFEPRWVARAWKTPLWIFRDFGILTAALAGTLLRRRKPFQSGFKTIPLPAAGSDATSAARRAWASWVFTISPNNYVVRIERDRNAALVHALVLKRARDELP
jgi:multisubunit Na+/H+ antiporter MnhE subunit